MKQELKDILNKLVEIAKNNSDHHASYNLIGRVEQSDEVIDYIKELIDEGYISEVSVMGHTNFSCTVTEKEFEMYEWKVF